MSREWWLNPEWPIIREDRGARDATGRSLGTHEPGFDAVFGGARSRLLSSDSRDKVGGGDSRACIEYHVELFQCESYSHHLPRSDHLPSKAETARSVKQISMSNVDLPTLAGKARYRCDAYHIKNFACSSDISRHCLCAHPIFGRDGYAFIGCGAAAGSSLAFDSIRSSLV